MGEDRGQRRRSDRDVFVAENRGQRRRVGKTVYDLEEGDKPTTLLTAGGAFDDVQRVGSGTFGTVFKAKARATGDAVALKMQNPGASNGGQAAQTGIGDSALRELRALQAFPDHPNVVSLKAAFEHRVRGAFFVMQLEYCGHNLYDLIHDEWVNACFAASEIKCLVRQLLTGLAAMHERQTMHRDLKPCNLLYSDKGLLKIADLGSARRTPAVVAGNEPLTPVVTSLYYRAPEVLLGAPYGPEIDVWAAGLIMAELLSGTPLLPGQTDTEMLRRMVRVFGTPSSATWPGVEALDGFAGVANFPPGPNRLRETFPDLSPDAFDLMDRMLTYDPKKRITAREALEHEYFRTDPLPMPIDAMPTFPEAVLQQRRDRKRQEKKRAAANERTAALLKKKAKKLRQEARGGIF